MSANRLSAELALVHLHGRRKSHIERICSIHSVDSIKDICSAMITRRGPRPHCTLHLTDCAMCVCGYTVKAALDEWSGALLEAGGAACAVVELQP